MIKKLLSTIAPATIAASFALSTLAWASSYPEREVLGVVMWGAARNGWFFRAGALDFPHAAPLPPDLFVGSHWATGLGSP